MRGTIYTLRSPDGVLRYVGSTTQSLQARLAQHRHACIEDPTCCPLYRYAQSDGGGRMDGWRIQKLIVLNSEDPDVFTHLLLRLESVAIELLRRHHPLLNNNTPQDADADRRVYMRRWRRQHGQGQIDPTTGRSLSYMARKSREHRARRRAARENVDGTINVTTPES